MASYELAAFPVSIGEVVVEGDTARARSFVQESLWNVDGSFRSVFGQYDDELVRRNGRWLFKSRRYTVLRSTVG